MRQRYGRFLGVVLCTTLACVSSFGCATNTSPALHPGSATPEGAPTQGGAPSGRAATPATNTVTTPTQSPPPLPVAATPKPDLVRYTGPVEHIFFHPLIAYPQRAFDGDSMSKGFNDWFVTVSEFDKMLVSLYNKGFILIDINSLFTLKTVGGQTRVVQNQLMLPKGKKPLVLSIDDINYYDYMIKNGTVRKLVVDAEGHIGALSTDMNGQETVAYDDEIVPILDAFVKAHPDFSWEGAKGMLNLTGYEGVLGYRTNDAKSPQYEEEVAGAKKVIAALKQDGWVFASHSWGHLDDNQISYQRFVQDTNRWKREVEPLVGPTAVYVYPFGSRVPTGGDKYQYLLKSGFHVLCSVGPSTYVQWTPDSLMLDRRHIDGISLHSEAASLRDLFDAKQVIDGNRPATY